MNIIKQILLSLFFLGLFGSTCYSQSDNHVRSSEFLQQSYGSILGHQGENYFFVSNTNSSRLDEPKSSVMTYTKLSQNNFSVEIFEKDKLNFDDNKGVFLEAKMQGDFIYELYYAGKYGYGPTKNADRFIYLVKRDIENFEIIGSPKEVKKGKFHTSNLSDMYVDSSGIYIIEIESNLIKRFDFDLKEVWKLDVPFLDIEDKSNDRQIKSKVIFDEKDESLIITSNIGKCNDCSRSIFGNALYKPSNSVSLVISKIDKNGIIQSFSPELKESISYERLELFTNENSVTGIFEINNSLQSGFHFYNWNLETGEVIKHNKILLRVKDIINEEVLTFGRLIFPREETIEEEKLLSRVGFELCERLEDDGYLLTFNTSISLLDIFDYSAGGKTRSLFRCNYMTKLDSKGEIVWTKPTIFGGALMNGNWNFRYSNSIITRSNKLVTFGKGFLANFENGEYRLKKVSAALSSNCMFIANFDMSSGELLSVKNFKSKSSERISNNIYDNYEIDEVLIRMESKQKKRVLIIN